MDVIDTRLIGASPEMASLLRTARVVAAADATVLLVGETGTGKELLAEVLHAWSRRHQGPFLPVNCAALPEALVESELFGCRRGAFTGAVSDQPGKVVAADGGTLFLDEVGELPLAAQAKLLRFLESGEVQPVGQARPRRVSARVVAATNRDLTALVADGRFRQDLFYRLNVVPIDLPPLRERAGDVPVLLEHFLRRLARVHDLAPPRLSPEALRRLKAYRWPGNVRELRNVCERLVILHAGGVVDVAALPVEIRSGAAPEPARLGLSLPDGGLRLDEVERSLIGQALAKTAGNRSQAARLLGISRDTLLYRLKKYALS